ncbi:MAG: DMT family transporter [Parafannyhessea sp.]|uniref:DMT family transporter n=1 Tax=Parafannyhessea sp. TaxID=2847324 RepID=UPI003F024910
MSDKANATAISERESRRNAFLSSTPGLLLFATASCLLWGSAFPCTKIGNALFGIASSATSSQLLFAGVRFTIAGCMVIAFMSVKRGRPLLPRATDWKAILRLSLFQTVLQYGLFYPGLSRSSGVASSIIEASASFVVIILAALVFRQEKLTSRKVLGCLVGFAGVLLVNLKPGGSLSFNPIGEGLVFLSTIAAATSSCLIRDFSKRHDPVLLSGWQFLVGGVVLTLIGRATGGQLTPSRPAALALLAYMGFISAAAYTLWSMLLSANPVSRVAVFGFMNPVFGVVLSAILLNETSALNPLLAVVALVLVSAGIVIVNRGPSEVATDA